MSFIAAVFLIFLVIGGVLGAVAYLVYRQRLRKAKAIERGLKMVPVLIHLPPQSDDTHSGSRDVKEVMREKTAQAEVLYNLLAGTAVSGFRSTFYGQRHVALELIATDGLVHFYAAVPVAMVSTAEKAIQTAYPGARMEMVEDHNIFNQQGRLAATLGGEMILRTDSAYPIATYAKLDRDPMEALLTSISALEKTDGVAFQLMLRPATPNWIARSLKLVDMKRRGHKHAGFTPTDMLKAAVKAPSIQREEEQKQLGGQSILTNLEQTEIESIEEKTKHPGFEVLIRVIVSTGSVARSQQLLRDIATTFALYDAPGLNGFTFLPAVDVQGLVTAFIFRFFPPELKGNVLNSVELATLFHLPDAQFTPAAAIERQKSKQVDGPAKLPSVGLLFGFNEFRGVKKEIRLSVEDRRRHTYILGQTGTGKSTMLENLAVQDMLAGNGFAFIDPHGDSAEKLLALVPKNRAEDIIYFNPSDTEFPLGLNLFEFSDPSQKDFLVQETINMLYKLYDPGHTGIIGPRYEHWYRNAALTLMSDPNGSTFIEIPKVFTDTEYLKKKFRYLKDPTVIDFWTKEMGQTSDYHKSEMLGWFVSKFGAFQNNEMMRNIIGQTKSSFNIRDIMDQKKILIVNLSKGRIGELNSQLLGMIFVIKFQAAAMSRANISEDQRSDFCLYVDEFQNFSTDSFASILSEARKYRLNLLVANQFIGQLSPEIRDAVFGNIGTIVAHRMGPEDAEFMVKQFAPVFDASDLMNLPNYNAAMRLMVGGLPSQPFTMVDSPPLGNPNLELGLAVKQLSAAKYGHARAQVEADIFGRLSSTGTAASGSPAPASLGALPTPDAPASAASEPAAPQPGLAQPVADPMTAAMAVSMPAAPAPAPLPGGTDDAFRTPQIGQRPMTALEQARARVLSGNVPTPPALQPEPPAQPTEPIQPLAQSPAPSPIGAPPIDLPPAVAPPVAPVAPEPITTMSPVQPLPEGPAVDLPGVAAPPPPIGAPPIDLPITGEAAADDPVAQAGIDVLAQPAPWPTDAGSLSFMDITGGRLPGQPAGDQVQQAEVPILEADEDALPSAPAMPLGSGEPAPNDPYAGIDVLGDLRPPALVADDALTSMAPTDVPMQAEAMPGDPNAGVALTEAESPAALEADVSVAGPLPATTEWAEPAEPVEPLPRSAVTETAPALASAAPVEEASTIVGDIVEPAVSAGAESFIHFVDPAAEKLLAAPEDSRAESPVAVQPEPSPFAPPSRPVVEVMDPDPEVHRPMIELRPASVAEVELPQPVAVPRIQPVPVEPLVELPEAPGLELRPADPTPELPVVQIKAVPPVPVVVPTSKPIDAIQSGPVGVSAPISQSKPDEPGLESVAQMLVEAHVPVPTSQADIKRGAVEIAAAQAQVVQPQPVSLPEPPAPDKPAVAPVPETASEAEPAPVVNVGSPQEQVKRAQQEIDDLLSQSLIRLDGRKRLAEPAQEDRTVDPEDDQELAVSVSKQPAKKLVLKPISSRPLEAPRVDIQQLAQAEERRERQTAAAQTTPAAVLATQPVSPAPTPAALLPVPQPSTARGLATPVIVKPGGNLLPVVEPVDEMSIPQAESLAVDDVARARASREAQQKLAMRANDSGAVRESASAQLTQQTKEAAAAARAPEAKISRHQQRRRDGRPAEKIESQAEAAHNQPTAAGVQAAALAGKLIMPSTEKPKPSDQPQRLVKPKQLAPGEVFVDEQGNVLVGD